MTANQRVVRERRQYNQWVARETLEDYALRYTAASARKSSFRVGNTALGPIAFLACEAIGGTITVACGFPNALAAITAFSALMFLVALPIAYYAARYGVDVDLLTRGAGFGYLGSTLTSLIYASFTFLLFSIEASILSLALKMLFGIPLAVAHLVSALVVIPIAIYGITLISRTQLATQPIWLALQFLPVLYVAWKSPQDVAAWTHFAGVRGGGGSLRVSLFGVAASLLLSLLPQIGEQVDYLRFLPARAARGRLGWWTALVSTGPGWVLIGAFKLLAGSLLAVMALRHGMSATAATQPTEMYRIAFERLVGSPRAALVITGVFVIVCQLKINVTNAYAGSIAWSNFFSRLTHSHPGRVVWLVFNVLLAFILMEVGVFGTIEAILQIYANFAAGWIGAITADLVVNKRLGWSPPFIEFRRAHLYDVNPVGVGALLLSVVASTLAYLGVFGTLAQQFSPFIALAAAFLAAPAIAWATRGRYYLARSPDGLPPDARELRCSICENVFERADMALCPAYSGPICSLCCTLESRCRDACKPAARIGSQLRRLARAILPARIAAAADSRAASFIAIFLLFNLATGLVLALIDHQVAGAAPAAHATVAMTLWLVFFSLLLPSGVGAWLIVLSHESRRSAERESVRQTAMLMDEIEAHRRTDAALQKAKEVAEAANLAKTRYIVGISHEIRTPLNSIYGYAQLLESGQEASPDHAVRIIRRSSEHLSSLIDGLLDVSRIENGVLRLSRDSVQLDELLGQLVDMFRPQANAKGLRFRYERPPHLPGHVHTDQKRLRQILINLLSNAVKYTERGEVSLTVRYRSEVAQFDVGDTGSGIAERDLERIFEPFERGDGSAARSVPGTGLGLTITKLLTQLMGGEVTVQSREGTGTTFTVRLSLPRVRVPVAETANLRRPCGYTGARRRVLLADDDPLHLELVQSVLRPLGFTMLAARDAKTCLHLARQSRPDLILLDLSLPDGSGWEVTRELRSIGELTATKILVVSANAHEQLERAPGEYDGFLVKPFHLATLLEHVRVLLELEWIRDEQAPVDIVGKPVAERSPAGSSRHHLEDLYRLGRIGHIRGIESKLRELELEDPGSEPVVARLRECVARFDLRRYMSALEAMRSDV